VLLSIEASALNRAGKTSDGLDVLWGVIEAEHLRPAVGIQVIYDLARTLADDTNRFQRQRLFQLVVDLDPAFLVPAEHLLDYELMKLQRGDAIVPCLMADSRRTTMDILIRLARGESDAEAVRFTKSREAEIDSARRQDRKHVRQLEEATERGDIPQLASFEEFCEYLRPQLPRVIQRRYQGRIDAQDASRLADRLEEFRALRTTVMADLHFMFFRVKGRHLPSREKTADYRPISEAAYCTAVLIEDTRLLGKVGLLNPDLRAIPYPRVAA